MKASPTTGLTLDTGALLALDEPSRAVTMQVMTLGVAGAVGLACPNSGHADVIDVHVALRARERHHAVVTSDPGDIARIDPTVPLIRA